MQNDIDPFALTTEQYMGHVRAVNGERGLGVTVKWDPSSAIQHHHHVGSLHPMPQSNIPAGSSSQHREPEKIHHIQHQDRIVLYNIIEIVADMAPKVLSTESMNEQTINQYLQTIQTLKNDLSRIKESPEKDTAVKQINWLQGKLESKLSYSAYLGEELDKQHIHESGAIGKISNQVTEIENWLRVERQEGSDSVKGKEQDHRHTKEEQLARLDHLKAELEKYRSHSWTAMQIQRIIDLKNVILHGTAIVPLGDRMDTS